MAYSKVIVNSTTIMDVTQDTVTASNLLYNIVATKNDGTKVTGTIQTTGSGGLTVNGPTVTAGAGYYATSTSTTVSSGTVNNPVATKGSVSNHQITVTPSVSSSTGWITGGTKNGTAVTVSASELVNGTITITQAGNTDVTNYATASVAEADIAMEVQSDFYTENGQNKWRVRGWAGVESGDYMGHEGYIADNSFFVSEYETYNAIASGTSITPTKSSQTIGGFKYMMAGAVTINPIPSQYIVPSGTKSITSNGTGIDVTSYASVDVAVPSSAPTLQTKTVTYTPSTATQTATITPDSGYNGLSQVVVTVSAMPLMSVPTATSASGSGTRKITVTPSTISQYINLPTGYNNATAYFQINPMPNGTAGTPSAVQGSVSNNRITITPTVTNTAGYIAGGTITGTAVTISASSLVSGTYSVSASGNHNITNYATASVPAGTAGTPVATKGTVSNHAISVTPTVTNTTGWIAGGTKNGTAITVSASELVSGTLTVTENGTVDVTNYASATISVEGGGSSGGGIQLGTKTTTPTSASSTIQFTGLSGNPTSFVVTSQADIATNTNGVTGVVFDGSALHGQTLTTQVTADTGFTKSYSNGTLTITATSAQFQANAYKLVYTYGGSTSDIHTADIQVGSGATSITFPVNGRPAYWSCIFKSNFSTSSGYQRVIVVVNDGSSIYGLDMDSSAHAAASWSATYNGGNLTISSQGTNNGGYFHQPGYYQLTYYVDESAPQYQARTVTPSTATQTVLPESGYDALSQVTVNPIPSNYIVPTGNITITENGTNINIAQYSTATVNVPTSGGSSKNTQVVTTAANYIANTTYTAVSGQTLTVSKTGTYDVLWVAWRSSTSSATYYGTQLYIDNTAHGTANTTWTGTGGQQNHLTNVSLSQGDVLTVRARSRGTSYRTYVANLTIIEQ